ncbi:MAG: endonuclease [Synergistales bacterium]|jgi:RNase H-fold protein (predicted Holliday junction resolvase)
MKTLLGLDPGKDKFGWAFVTEEGKLLASGIIPSALTEARLDALLAGDLAGLSDTTRENAANQDTLGFPALVLLGNGTAREGLAWALASRKRAFSVVDEAYTTLEARRLYWRLHPPGFLARLIPEGMRVPPRPIDDLAAWALVRRFLSGRSGNGSET